MTILAEASQPTRRAKWLAALGFRPKQHARVPEATRVYAVGDIHGCDAALGGLHARIEADAVSFSGRKVIVYLGDYVDRGPNSRGVIDRLIGCVPEGFSAHYVKGNHDQALLDFLADAQTYRAWRAFGAPETLLSYGVRPPLFDSSEKFEEARQALQGAMPLAHLEFLRSLRPSVVLGDYAFVHAGIRPGMSIEDQSEQDLLWIREDFLNCTAAHEKVIVHGHTPLARPLSLHNRIAVDTGAYATGVLSCVVLEGEGRRFIQADRG
jgi:serine/threonine protein phosphatase 1